MFPYFESTEAHAITKAKLRHLYGALPFTLPLVFLAAVLSGFLLYPEHGTPAVLTWLGLLTATIAWRYVNLLRFRTAALNNKELLGFQRRFSISAILTGIIWGSGLFALFPSQDLLAQALVVMLLAGLTAGSVVSLSASRRAAIGFVLTSTAPTVYRLFEIGDSAHTVLGLLSLVYLLFMFSMIVKQNQTITASLRQAWQFEQLSNQLKDRELTLQLILDSAPIGIFYYDKNLCIKDCNPSFVDLMQTGKERLTGLDMHKLLDARPIEALAAVLGGENGLYIGEYNTMHSDTTLWLRLITRPIYSNGQLLYGLGLIENLSEQHITEKRMEAFAKFYTQNPNPVFRCSSSGSVLYANQASRTLIDHLRANETSWNYFRRLAGERKTETIEYKSENAIYALDMVYIAEGDYYNVYGREITAEITSKQKIAYMAYHDELTGLPNRTHLLDKLSTTLAHMERDPHFGALIFIDLDRFKNINDTLGHDIGDKVLTVTAQRLKESFRKIDTVSRFGGDEFVILLNDLGDGREMAGQKAHQVARKTREYLSQPMQIEGKNLHITPSIGITIFDNNNQDPYDILKYSDSAMYQAKKRGRNAIEFYDQTIQQQTAERLGIENGLRESIEKGELSVYLQPKVESRSRKVAGAEALLRWKLHENTFIPPGRFIPIAEEIGLIHPISYWVIDQVCGYLKTWPDLHHISVNVSTTTLKQADFTQTVLDTLKHHTIDPHRLEIEVTEAIFMEKNDTVTDTMHTLQSSGVRFSVDDFGTGYSSLYSIKTMPVDTLKIDRSFIRDIQSDPNDAAIVETIISMAHHLGLQTVAEGVENEAQKQFLEKKSCVIHQGFLYSKPLDKAAFTKFLKQQGESRHGDDSR